MTPERPTPEAVTLTAITAKKRERVTLTFSDGSTLDMSAATAADAGLYAGKPFTPEALSSLRAAAAEANIRARALRILGYRAMSRQELFRRLVEKGEGEAEAEACVAWLSERGLLDDAAYAGMVVRHYAAKGYGPAHIRNELYRRGVPRALWDAALEEMPETEERLDALLRARLRGASPRDAAALKKATDALARRGYSWGEIRAAVERLRQNLGEEDW